MTMSEPVARNDSGQAVPTDEVALVRGAKNGDLEA